MCMASKEGVRERLVPSSPLAGLSDEYCGRTLLAPHSTHCVAGCLLLSGRNASVQPWSKSICSNMVMMCMSVAKTVSVA